MIFLNDSFLIGWLVLLWHCSSTKAFNNKWAWNGRNVQLLFRTKQQALPLKQSMAATTAPSLSTPISAHMAPAVPTENIRPSITDRARTITYICTGGTLCTTSAMDGVQGFPFGSYVDYILDENGWPVMLLSEQSLHTLNIQQNPAVSLFVQLPRSHQQQTSAALSRVTVMGKVGKIPDDQITALKMAFTIVHPYAEQIVDSSKFKLVRIEPEKIYFSGGFGVQATWVDVQEYSSAKSDVLAQDVPNVLSRVNIDKQNELYLLCKHYLKLDNVDFARIQAIDRLGIDIRVKRGNNT